MASSHNAPRIDTRMETQGAEEEEEEATTAASTLEDDILDTTSSPAQHGSATEQGVSHGLGSEASTPSSRASIESTVAATGHNTVQAGEASSENKNTANSASVKSSNTGSTHSNHSLPDMDVPNTPPPNGKKKRKRPNNDDPSKTSGRWTQEEHEAFLKGLAAYGREWKRVAQHITTRTSAQVRSHAQKYLRKQDQLLLAQSPQQHPTQRNDIFAYLNRMHDNDDASNASHVSLDNHSNHQLEHYYEPAASSASLQLHVDRILARPHAVAQQVQDTLAALQERYRELQRQMRDMTVTTAAPPTVAAASTDLTVNGSAIEQQQQQQDVQQNLPEPEAPLSEALQHGTPNEQEWIALHVLHRKLSSPIESPQLPVQEEKAEEELQPQALRLEQAQGNVPDHQPLDNANISSALTNESEQANVYDDKMKTEQPFDET